VKSWRRIEEGRRNGRPHDRYTYDPEGNCTRRFCWTDADSDGLVDADEQTDLTDYEWDHRNRLIGVTARDTLEGPVGSLFSNFMQKTPDAMFRRINPDYFYPTYGDDSTSEDTAPTLGKFYVRLKKDAHYGLWGNFKVG